MSRVHGLKAKPQDPEKATKGSRKRKNAATDAVVKKQRASKSSKKEPVTPPTSHMQNPQLAEQKRRMIEDIKQQLETDPRAYEQLSRVIYSRT